MKKYIILAMLVCSTTLSLAQTKSAKKVVQKPNIEVVLNQQVEILSARIDSMTIAHQQAIDKVLSETKADCSAYYDRLDNEIDRGLTKFSWIWGLIGVVIGIVIPIVINVISDRNIKGELREQKEFVRERLRDQDRITASRLREQYNEIKKQIKDQNNTFGKRFAEHKAYIDKVSNNVENYERSSKIHQLIGEAQSVLEKDSNRAIEIYSQVLELDHNNETALLCRGIAYSLLNKSTDALTDLNAALAINPRLARAYNNIGNVHSDLENFEKAQEFHTKALEIRLKTFGPNHPDVANSYGNLGVIAQNSDEFEKAMEYYYSALEINRSIFGERHTAVAYNFLQIATVCSDIGDFERAVVYYTLVIDMLSELLGESHPDLALAYNGLGIVHEVTEEYGKALECYFRALDIRKKSFGDSHPSTLSSYECYSRVMMIIKGESSSSGYGN